MACEPAGDGTDTPDRKMADPLSITCDVLTLVTLAVSSSVMLTATVRSLEYHNTQSRALKRELSELTAVLESLLETINANPDFEFDVLKSPLQRCGNACKEYGELVARFTKQSARPQLASEAGSRKNTSREI